MTDPRHGNDAWQQPQPYQGEGVQPTQPIPPFPPPYGQPASSQYPPPYQPVAAPPQRPNHVLHLILTVLTCGFWSSVWITLTARYWGVVDYRNPAEHAGMKRRTIGAVTVLAALGVLSSFAIAVATAPATTDITTVAAADPSSTEPPTVIDTTGPTPGLTVFPTPGAKAKPKTTVAQQQAIESAKSYLDFSGFSRAGLIHQLTSSAGEGFKKADAEYAVNHIKVDWNAEAVESAKSYLEMGGFSRAGLIQQLHSKNGEGFTLKQATYAANKVGL